MYKLKIKPNADKIFKKMMRREREQRERINEKIKEILQDPSHYKNLRWPLEDWKRVQIGHFVLAFSVDENTKTVTIEDYDHHDNIYKNK